MTGHKTGSRQGRATQILHLLLQKGKGSIEELAAAVEASPASVRRDLIKLEERGCWWRRQAAQDSF